MMSTEPIDVFLCTDAEFFDWAIGLALPRMLTEEHRSHLVRLAFRWVRQRATIMPAYRGSSKAALCATKCGSKCGSNLIRIMCFCYHTSLKAISATG